MLTSQRKLLAVTFLAGATVGAVFLSPSLFSVPLSSSAMAQQTAEPKPDLASLQAEIERLKQVVPDQAHAMQSSNDMSGQFVELRIDSPRFSVHEDVVEKCSCPSCNGELTKPILRHDHPASLMPLPKQNVPSRGWGEDFWVHVSERCGDHFRGVVDKIGTIMDSEPTTGTSVSIFVTVGEFK